MKKLNQYIDLLEKEQLIVENKANLDFDVEHISYSSMDVKENTLFICKGANFKGEYLKDAFDKGAKCYIATKPILEDVPHIIVNDIRLALTKLSEYFYDGIWNDNLSMVGITGTKGKSTTAVFIKAILDEYKKNKCSFLSGVYTFDGRHTDKAPTLTTPETLELHKHLNESVKNECEYLVMEVSSQALKYRRTDALQYKIGVFLNLGEDHISDSEHPDFDDYFNSKLLIFKQCDIAVVNGDIEEEFLAKILNEANKYCSKVITYAEHKDADVKGQLIKADAEQLTFNLEECGEMLLNIGGDYNLSNALCAIAICYELGIPFEFIKSGLANVKVPGRMETYRLKDKDVVVIIDKAHNKMSYEALFKSLKETYPDRKMMFMFGCVGDKAYNRRKEGGEVADREADYIVLTEKESGKEKTIDICNEIKSHISNKDKVEIIEDREEAIVHCLNKAENGWVIILAGDGHVMRGNQIVKDGELVIEYNESK